QVIRRLRNFASIGRRLRTRSAAEAPQCSDEPFSWLPFSRSQALYVSALWGRYPFDQLRPIVDRAVDAGADRIDFHLLGREWRKQISDRLAFLVWVQPLGVIARMQDDGHSVVDVLHQFVGSRCDQGECQEWRIVGL